MVNSKETIQVLLCSLHLSGKHMLFFAAINYFLSITATLGNTVILFALNKESSLHPPSRLLYRCLALTDLLVGIISQPVLAVYFTLLVIADNYCIKICVYVASAGALTFTILSAVSMLTMTAISVDRLLALSLGLRYRHVVTLRRVRALVLCFWISSIAFTVIMLREFAILKMYVYALNSLCLLVSVCCYSKIVFALRHHQGAIQDQVHQDQPSGETAQNMQQYRKTVYSNVHSVDVNSMLSAIQYSFDHSYNKWVLPISSCNLGIYNNSRLFKLVFKPDSLLLED